MKIKEMMTRNCTYINPQTTLAEAARIMQDQDIGFLPVAENDRMVGMITDRDIVVRAVAKSMSPSTGIGDIMSPQTYYCFDDQDADEVCANMADLKVRRLPVVNRDKRLVGIVSLGDLAQEVSERNVGETVQVITEPHSAARAA